MSPDMVNGAFEAAGALFTFQNTRRVVRDDGYAGIYLPAIAFFTSWGLWNLFYYPSLGQPWSFHGGLMLVLANLSWIGAMLWYGRRK